MKQFSKDVFLKKDLIVGVIRGEEERFTQNNKMEKFYDVWIYMENVQPIGYTTLNKEEADKLFEELTGGFNL